MVIITEPTDTSTNFHTETFSSKPLKVLLEGGLLLSFLVGRKSTQVTQGDQTIKILSLVFSGQIAGFITSLDFNNVQFLASKCMNDSAGKLLDLVKEKFKVLPVDRKRVEIAATFPLNKFGTAIALACAEVEEIDVIITETPEASRNSKIPILEADEFIRRYSSEEQKLLAHGSAEDFFRNNISKPEEELLEIINGWYIEHFEVHVSATKDPIAELSLWKKSDGTQITRYATGNGPVEALFNALNHAVYTAEPTYRLPLPIVSHIALESEQLGADSQVDAIITVKVNDESHCGEFKNTDTVKAVFYAYLKAVRASKLTDSSERKIVSAESLIKDYRNGKRNFAGVTLIDSKLNEDLKGINLQKATIIAGDLQGIKLSEQGQDANLKEIKINLGQLQNADFSYADLNDAEIVGAEMQGAKFTHADLSDAVIRGSILDGAKIIRAKLDRINLIACSLKGAKIKKTKLNQAILSGVDLTEAEMQRSELIQAILNDACLEKVKLAGATLSGANFSRANLVSADLRGSTSLETTFTKAKLSQAKLSRANFSRAKLVSADLRGSTLDGTIFAEADLSKANLEGLDLTKADLTGATLDYAELRGARLTSDQVQRLGGYSDRVNLKQAIVTDTPLPSHSS